MSYRVVPIAPELTDAVRRELKSPQYGHPAHVETAAGYGPCRSCLRMFEVGREDRVLFTYNPFDGYASYPLPGPIFIHHAECAPFADAGLPPDLSGLPIVLEAYGEGRRLLHQVFVQEGNLEVGIVEVLAHGDVQYVHLRNAEAGCFIARVERAA